MLKRIKGDPEEFNEKKKVATNVRFQQGSNISVSRYNVPAYWYR